MKQRSDLRSKRIVILGGSSGIGLAVAQQASAEGANVVIASSNPERVRKAAEEVGATRRDTRSISLTNRLSKLSFPSSARSITSCLPPVTASTCTILPPQI